MLAIQFFHNSCYDIHWHMACHQLCIIIIIIIIIINADLLKFVY